MGRPATSGSLSSINYNVPPTNYGLVSNHLQSVSVFNHLRCSPEPPRNQLWFFFNHLQYTPPPAATCFSTTCDALNQLRFIFSYSLFLK